MVLIQNFSSGNKVLVETLAHPKSISEETLCGCQGASHYSSTSRETFRGTLCLCGDLLEMSHSIKNYDMFPLCIPEESAIGADDVFPKAKVGFG